MPHSQLVLSMYQNKVPLSVIPFNSKDYIVYFFWLQINSKYSEELAQESLEWIKAVTAEPINTSGDTENFFEVLKDGVILCKLANALQPGSIKKINESKMAFKCMENISAFLECAKNFGVPTQETFQSVDLWERQNLNSVVICLQSLGRKVREREKEREMNTIIMPRIMVSLLGLQIQQAIDWPQGGGQEWAQLQRGAAACWPECHLPAVWFQQGRHPVGH